MHVDESLLAHVEDTRRFTEQYMAAMAASPLGFATAEDALRTRAVLDAAVAPLPPDRLQPQVLHVGAAEPAVEVRVFVPERPQGVCIEFHAGAWIIGSARAGDDRSAEIAERCSVAVVSVEYRMVPEHLPPAQLEDALNVIDWVRTDGRARRGRRSHRADRRVGRQHARRAQPGGAARAGRARHGHRGRGAGLRPLRRVRRPEPAARHCRPGRLQRRPVAGVPRAHRRAAAGPVDLAALRRSARRCRRPCSRSAPPTP